MNHSAALYMTPPSTQGVRDEIVAGRLGMIATPRQGNPVEADFHLWCADNGCFGTGYPGDDAYIEWLGYLAEHSDRCVFATAPDVVGNHDRTAARSRPMLDRIRAAGYPVAFVAQDGMEWSTWDLWDEIDCLFIGGSTEWKLGPAARDLAYLAGSLGKWVHVGRVNSHKRLDYASMFAHSVDGTHITFGPDLNLPKVLAWTDRITTEPTLFSL